jgi:drug/metabolite transporter (DMT)-like permease
MERWLRRLASPYLLLTLTALFWAGHTVVYRAAVNEIPPLGLAFWRWAVTVLLAAPFVAGRSWRARGSLRRHWRLITILSVLNVVGFSGLVYIALERTSAVNAGLLQGSLPICIVLVAAIATEARTTARQGAGVAIGFAGMALIVLRGDPAALVRLEFNTGDLIMLAAVLLYALYSILLRRLPKAIDATMTIFATGVVGTLLLAPLYFWESASGRTMPLDATAVAVIAYTALFASLAAQIFWVAAVAKVGPTTAGYFIYLTPVFVAVMATTLLGEAFRWYHGVGIALIFGGIWLATSKRG